MKESSLLTRILEQAKKLVDENNCSGLSRDYIMASALSTVASLNPAQLSGAEKSEYESLRQVLSHETGGASAGDEVERLLKLWRNQRIGRMEVVCLGVKRSEAENEAKRQQNETLTADVYIGVLLKELTPGMKSVFGDKKAAQKPAAPPPQPAAATASQTAPPAAGQTSSQASKKGVSKDLSGMTLDELTRKTKALRTGLLERVLGQEHAVNTFTGGYFESVLDAMTNPAHKGPRASFLFVGPPGVGKTYLAKQAAELLGADFLAVDMTEYNNNLSGDELLGNMNNRSPFMRFIKEHPDGIILLDEVEKCHYNVMVLFLQLLEEGRLHEKSSGKEVSFRDATIIMTTNVGKELYENSTSANLSYLSREVIIDALKKEDKADGTTGKALPSALCSRFAAGNVIMFNHLEADVLHRLVQRGLSDRCRWMSEKMKLDITIDDDVSTALLLAEGASADGRMVDGRTKLFFGSEIFEFGRLATSRRIGADLTRLRSLRISVDLEHAAPEIQDLFRSKEPERVLLFSQKPGLAPVSAPACDIVLARTADEGLEMTRNEDPQLILLDLEEAYVSGDLGYMNRDDLGGEGRQLMTTLLTRYGDVPVLLLERTENPFSQEEKESFLARGISRFLTWTGSVQELPELLAEDLVAVRQRRNMITLARANKLLSYETGQAISQDQTMGEIMLFDMKLTTAVRAGDEGNVMSLMEKPDVRLADVKGAEDAKAELQFLLKYLKSPRQFRGAGIGAPRGILLYGPPGTGKTMLARALAGESGATFLPVQGNQFFQMYVGQSPSMVRELFAKARRYAPSIIFVDEIDVIARARGTATHRDGGTNVQEEILTAFLAEMDGFNKDDTKPVFVLGATNYSPDSTSEQNKLDEAFMRRFDRRILIDLPGRDTRLEFLREYAAKRPIFQVSDEELESIAERSVGQSLAILTSVMEMAVRTAMRLEKAVILDADLEEAFETYKSGEKRERNEEAMLKTARHETGHALVSWLGGEKPSYVSVVSRGDHGGYMQHESAEDKGSLKKKEMLDRIRTALAGRAAEIVCYGPDAGLDTGASSDLATASGIARAMLCVYGMDEGFGMAVLPVEGDSMQQELRKAVNRILREQLDEAVRLITLHRAALDRVVEVLLKKSHLRGDELDELLKANI